MVRKLIQTKKTSLSYGINDSATAMRLVNLLKLDGSSISASDIGDRLRGTFDPGTSREEIFYIDGANVTVNSDGTVDITGVVRGLQEVSPYSTGGFATDHPAGAVVIFGNNPQVYAEKADLINDNEFEGENNFQVLPTSDGGFAVDDEELVTYAQLIAVATGTTSINRVVVAGNAGATVVAGDTLYLDSADNEWKPTDADSAPTVNNVIKGIAQGAGTDGNPILNGVLLFGLDSNQIGRTPGAIQYFSNTAGDLSETPGTIEVTAGQAKSATEVIFFPSFNQQLTEDQQDALAGDNGTPSDANTYVTQSGLQRNTEKYAADAGANDTYVITLSPVPAALADGMVVYFKANTANTGAATLNINSLGAKAIVKYVNTTLATGDIAAGMRCTVIYDLGIDSFVLQNPIANVVTTSTPDFKLTSPSDTKTISAVSLTTSTITKIAEWTSLTGNADDVYKIIFETAFSGTPSNGAYLALRINDSATASSYVYSNLYLNNTTPAAIGASTTQMRLIGNQAGNSVLNVLGEVEIKASVSIAGTTRSTKSTVVSNGSAASQGVEIGSGSWVDTSTEITSLQLYAYQESGSPLTISGIATLYKINRA